ncbi:glycosyltransferase [Motilimonas sp. KMU-193]|uniref:glycosyltransferase n=1 Tax=Motilimonas sp. KMU-193 TaxID=3388668 RepID=UPI00396B356C
MPKVTFFVGGFPVLSETFVLNQVAAMVESGFDVEVIAMSPEQSGKEHPWVKNFKLMEKLKTAYTSSKRKKRILDFMFAIMLDLVTLKWNRLSWLKKSSVHGYMLGRCFEGIEGPVICHFGPMGAELAKLLEVEIIKNVKIITIFHGYDMSVRSELEKEKNNYTRLFKYGYLMLPVSDFWKKRLVEMGCPASKISVHRMGVDVDDFKFIPRYIDGSKESIRLISVCRFVEKKGIPILLAAMKELPDNFSLTLVGGGPMYKDITEIVKKLGLESRVFVEGALPSNIVAKKLSESDAFVLPSITAPNGDMEGIPVALMEAMASGLLVFSSFHSGIPELIEHEKSGFLSPEGDYVALKDALIHAFNGLNTEDRQLIANYARQVVEKDFNLKQLNQGLQNILSPVHLQ